MFQSLRLGRILGIETTIHWSFWFLMIYVLASSISQGAIAAMHACFFVLAIFFCVYLHELGHAMAARKYGIRTVDITMLPIGGLARLERMPKEAWAEFWITVAGPAVNVVIACALIGGLLLRGGVSNLLHIGWTGQDFLEQVAAVNIALAIFNMIPAIPMDGGRVLRSILQMWTNRIRATEIAARISRYIAVIMIFLGFFYGFTLSVIGVFILIQSFQELVAVRMQTMSTDGGGFGASPFGQPTGRTDFEGDPNALDAIDVRRVD